MSNYDVKCLIDERSSLFLRIIFDREKNIYEIDRSQNLNIMKNVFYLQFSHRDQCYKTFY
jgi:hypothetical protein